MGSTCCRADKTSTLTTESQQGLSPQHMVRACSPSNKERLDASPGNQDGGKLSLAKPPLASFIDQHPKRKSSREIFKLKLAKLNVNQPETYEQQMLCKFYLEPTQISS